MKNERINELVKEVKKLEAGYKYFNKSLLYEDKLTGKIFHNHKNCDEYEIYRIIYEAANDTFIYNSDVDRFLKNYKFYEFLEKDNAEYIRIAVDIWEDEVIKNDIDTMKKVISIIDDIIELQNRNASNVRR